MAKRRKKSTGEQPARATSMVQNPAGLVLGQQLGVTNLARVFRADQNHNGPHIAIKLHDNAFPRGFSSGTLSDQDSTAAVNTALSASADLNPITVTAQAFCEEHWPILNALLQSGTGTRYAVDRQAVIRYYSMTVTVAQMIQLPLTLNYLTTAFDWSEIAPYSPNVPPAIWELTELFDANDVGINDVWKPLFNRLATKVIPPEFCASIIENGLPYLGDQYGHVLRVNAPSAADNVLTLWDVSAYIATIIDFLEYLENDLATTHNTLASFLPYRVGPLMTMFKGYDPMYEEIDYNSSLETFDYFGDTGDPDNTKTITCGTGSDNGDSIIFYHKGAHPMLKSVVSTAIYDEIYNVTDNTWTCLSTHKGGRVYFIDDALNLIEYNGTPTSSAEAMRYLKYYPNRFQVINGTSRLAEGFGKAGFMPAIIAREEIIRANRAYTNFLFGNAKLKNVLSITGGSSVRTIQKLVAEAWAS
jgi:hypothetical protein